MKLYGRATSFNVQKVLWLLDELGVKYQHIQLGGRFGGLDSEEFKALNPMQKVPVLVDGDHSIWESHTILRFLVASYGSLQWYSRNPYQRSLYERWMDWSHLVFQNAFMDTFWGYYRTPKNKRDMVAVSAALAKCHDCLLTLDQALEKTNFFAGESLTLADICAGSVIYRLVSQGLDVQLPSQVKSWYQKLQQRPGYQRWVMSDFSELKAREDY